VTAIDPARVQALAERLVAMPTVSPDPVAEIRCAAAIRQALPPGLEAGEWLTADGRPVVWALLRGGSPRTVVLLTHYDTVGIDEYQSLGDPAGVSIALRPEALRARLLALDPASLPAGVGEDLDQERRSPGTWMFGRGALDMKSGLAAGIGALESIAAEPSSLEGSVLFVACPDEEHESAGMLRAVPGIAALRQRLDFRGALNLDYTERPVAYDGVAGKCLAGLYVVGQPTHVGNPFAGADATQLAAAIVDRVTTSAALTESVAGGVPPVALRLRDVKPRYDVQTSLEAEVELNLLAFERPLERTLDLLETEVKQALADVGSRMARLAGPRGIPAPRQPQVLRYDQLAHPAGPGEIEPPGPSADARAASWGRIRAAWKAARRSGPAVVIAVLPPYYPRLAPRAGGLGDRLRPWLQHRGVDVERHYRYISDASYLAWRGDAAEVLEAVLPSWGREYRLPVAESAALDLDVVTLGPWGRDAHGLFERVDRRFAFEILPELIAGAVREAVRP
jgi:arginine utilization protein RocB